MKRALPILVLVAGLLWLAPAVRALPLATDEAPTLDVALAATPDLAGLAAEYPDAVAAQPAPDAARAAAPRARPSRRGVPQLVYVGLLGLLILGTERRTERKNAAARNVAPPQP